jgi:nucleoside phosphorylase
MPLVDIAVVTALAEELQTVREVFSQQAIACGTDRRGNIDADLYRLPIGSQEYAICLASGFGMGGAKMAAFATDVFARWRPVAAILTGIAGVVKTQWLQLGDVAVAEQVFAYSNVAVIDGQLVFRKSGYPGQQCVAPGREPIPRRVLFTVAEGTARSNWRARGASKRDPSAGAENEGADARRRAAGIR